MLFFFNYCGMRNIFTKGCFLIHDFFLINWWEIWWQLSMRPLGGLAFTAYPANKEWHPHCLFVPWLSASSQFTPTTFRCLVSLSLYYMKNIISPSLGYYWLDQALGIWSNRRQSFYINVEEISYKKFGSIVEIGSSWNLKSGATLFN